VEHLTLDQLVQYREGRLSGASLLAADDHIAACEPCRRALSQSPAAVTQLAEIAESLARTVDLSAFHLSYQDLQERVDGCTPSDRVAQIEAHLGECAFCRLELEDLRSFSASLKVTRMPARKAKGWLPFLPVAAAVLAAVILTRPHPQVPASQASVPRKSASSAVNTADLAACPEGAAPSDCELLAQVVRDGALPVALRKDLRGNRSALLSGSPEGESFRVTSPVGEVVLANRPEFRWQARTGATSYRVEVFDLSYTLVTASPKLTATSWTPNKPLDRGKTYAWQVTAAGKGEPVTAPKPPDPEARFEVVSTREAAAIEQARKLSPPNHLLLAAKFAAAGLCKDAQSELGELATANPASTLPAQLRQDLAKRCPVD
jgi:hypothetical protein